MTTMLVGMWAWYTGCLDAFPLYTKSLTSAVISLAGDGGAQFHEQRIRARKVGRRVGLSNFRYDRRRGLTNFADSALVCGPLLHYGYGLLESAIPVADACGGGGGVALSPSRAAAAHVLIDDFVFDAIFIALMFVSTGIGEGYRPSQIARQCKRDYVPAVKAMWKASVFLMPLEFCLFRFLPLSLRVLGMNFIEIIWDALVSFMIHKRRKPHADDRPRLVAA